MIRYAKTRIDTPSQCVWREQSVSINQNGEKNYKMICSAKNGVECKSSHTFPVACPLETKNSHFKELKLTPENLIRHLEKSAIENNKKHLEDGITPRIIYTTRDKKLGLEGEIFYVKHVGHFVLDEIELFTPSNIWVCFAIEGFENAEEFKLELKRIYGETLPSFLYLHKFKEIYLPEKIL